MQVAGAMFEAQPVEARQALAAALSSGQFAQAILVEFDFASAPLRLCNRTVPVIDGRDGHEWAPAPSTGAWEDVEGGPEVWAPLRTYQLTIPNHMVAEFEGELGGYPDLRDKSEYHGRAAVMSLQILDPGAGPHGTDQAIGYPIVLHSGRMDKLRVRAMRDGVRYEMQVEGILARKAVPGAGLLTPRDQKARFPGDLGADYGPEIEGSPPRWPDF